MHQAKGRILIFPTSRLASHVRDTTPERPFELVTLAELQGWFTPLAPAFALAAAIGGVAFGARPTALSAAIVALSIAAVYVLVRKLGKEMFGALADGDRREAELRSALARQATASPSRRGPRPDVVARLSSEAGSWP